MECKQVVLKLHSSKTIKKVMFTILKQSGPLGVFDMDFSVMKHLLPQVSYFIPISLNLFQIIELLYLLISYSCIF